MCIFAVLLFMFGSSPIFSSSTNLLFFDDFNYNSIHEMEKAGWKISGKTSNLYSQESIVGMHFKDGGPSIKRTFDLPPTFIIEIRARSPTNSRISFGLRLGNAEDVVWIDDNPNEGWLSLGIGGKWPGNSVYKGSDKLTDLRDFQIYKVYVDKGNVEVYKNDILIGSSYLSAWSQGGEFIFSSPTFWNTHQEFDYVKIYVKEQTSSSDKIVSLPASAIHGGKDTWLLEVDKQIVDVSPNETFTINVKYQIWSTPGIIRQAYFIASWTPTWPPPSGYYFPVYNGIPGNYPGVTETKTITIKAPSKPGEYVLWFVGHAHYSLSQAINSEIGERKDKTLSSKGHILVRVKQVDAPPSVIITEPSNGETFKIIDSSIKIRIRAQAIDDIGINKVEFFVNGDLIATDYDEPFETEEEFSAGTYTITIRAYDTSNQSNTENITIYVEKIDNPPTVMITTPKNGQTLIIGENSTEIEVVAEASDDYGIERVNFYVDGVYIGSDYSEPYTAKIRLYEGRHTIIAKAYDSSGKVDINGITVYVAPFSTISTSIIEPTINQTLSKKATIAFEYVVSNSTLFLKIESPYKVKDAQIIMKIPEIFEIYSYKCEGFLSGCMHLCTGTEHRWFVLREKELDENDGKLTLKFSLPENHSIKNLQLISVDLKNASGVLIYTNTDFPVTPKTILGKVYVTPNLTNYITESHNNHDEYAENAKHKMPSFRFVIGTIKNIVGNFFEFFKNLFSNIFGRPV